MEPLVTKRADVLDVLANICARLPEINSINTITMSPAPRAQRRIESNDREDRLLDVAVTLREERRMPFWDALLLESTRLNDGIPQSIIDAALYHQPAAAERTVSISVRENDWPSRLRRLIASIDDRDFLAISSKVDTVDGGAHIPMLDFSLRGDEPHSLSTAMRALERLEANGVLLSSGRSFHFYSTNLVDGSKLREFLGKALLLAPITDGRWIAHQLIEGSCALRISSNSRDMLPYVIESVNH